MTDAEKLAEALAFLADFAEWDLFKAEPMPWVSNPEDEPDFVTKAEPVWDWQRDAQALWRKLQ